MTDTQAQDSMNAPHQARSRPRRAPLAARHGWRRVHRQRPQTGSGGRALLVTLALATLAVPASAAVGPLAQAVGAQAQLAGTHVVVLKGLRFHPSTIAIRHGESVMWKWEDGGTAHNVTASSFHSRTQRTGSFTVRFTHRGTFSYRCTIHASLGMLGKVVVH